MLCPECGGKTRVVGTKTSFENERYRSCPKCDYGFTTIERIVGAVNTHLGTKVDSKKGMTDTVV